MKGMCGRENDCQDGKAVDAKYGAGRVRGVWLREPVSKPDAVRSTRFCTAIAGR